MVKASSAVTLSLATAFALLTLVLMPNRTAAQFAKQQTFPRRVTVDPQYDYTH